VIWDPLKPNTFSQSWAAFHQKSHPCFIHTVRAAGSPFLNLIMPDMHILHFHTCTIHTHTSISVPALCNERVGSDSKKKEQTLTERHLPQVYLSHTTFLSLLSFFSSLDFAQIHLPTPCHRTLYKHNHKKNLIPIPAFQPCRPSLGKWKLVILTL